MAILLKIQLRHGDINYTLMMELFLKNGITSKPVAESHYPKWYMSDKYMIKQLFPNRRAAYEWEYKQNTIQRGSLNKNMH